MDKSLFIFLSGLVGLIIGWCLNLSAYLYQLGYRDCYKLIQSHLPKKEFKNEK